MRARRRDHRREARQEGQRARDAGQEGRAGHALVHLASHLRPGADDQALKGVRRAVQAEEDRAQANRAHLRAVRPGEDDAIHQVARRHSPGGRREGDSGGGRQGGQVRRPPVRHVPEDPGRDQGVRRAPRHLRRVRLHLQE